MIFKKKNKITVAFSQGSKNNAWGGANQFTKLFSNYLQKNGYNVVYELNSNVDFVWLLDARLKSWSDQRFTWKDVRDLKKAKPELICAHRLNNCDARKANSTEIDQAMIIGDRIADYTVFLSKWLRDYFLSRGYPQDKAHCWIWNGGDPAIFHYRGSIKWETAHTFKLITHHWSDNWGKGFELYQDIDNEIYTGNLPEFSLTVCGKWPQEIQWKSATLIEPLSGNKLADVLRSHHGYITGSQAEPGGMHFLEALQCGLPVAAEDSGGGIVEVVKKHGIVFSRCDYKEALIELKNNYNYWRTKSLMFPHDGEMMCYQYKKVMEGLLYQNGIK